MGYDPHSGDGGQALMAKVGGAAKGTEPFSIVTGEVLGVAGLMGLVCGK